MYTTKNCINDLRRQAMQQADWNIKITICAESTAQKPNILVILYELERTDNMYNNFEHGRVL